MKRILPVHLSERELVLRASELATAITAKATLERAKRDQGTAFAKAIHGVEDRIAKLSTVVTSEYEDREIEVEEQTDFVTGMVTTVRLDTGEAVERRPVTDVDRQVSFLG